MASCLRAFVVILRWRRIALLPTLTATTNRRDLYHQGTKARGAFRTLQGRLRPFSAEGGIRPDVYVGLVGVKSLLSKLSGPLAGLLPLRREGHP